MIADVERVEILGTLWIEKSLSSTILPTVAVLDYYIVDQPEYSLSVTLII